MKTVSSILLFFTWFAGIVIAEGFWSTLFAIIFPFWSYYLVVERIVHKYL